MSLSLILFIGTVIAAAFILHLISQGIIGAFSRDPEGYQLKDFHPNFKTQWPHLLGMIAMAVVGMLAIHHATADPLAFAFASGFLVLSLLMVFVDFRHYIIPDSLNFLLLILGLSQSWLGVFVDAQTAIIGALVGFFSLLLINIVYKRLRGRDGIGMGDMKLLAAMGAWLGAEPLLIVLVIGGLSGTLFAYARLAVTSHKHDDPFPFGPMLVFGGFVTLLYGQAIHTAYENWLFGLLAPANL